MVTILKEELNLDQSDKEIEPGTEENVLKMSFKEELMVCFL